MAEDPLTCLQVLKVQFFMEALCNPICFKESSDSMASEHVCPESVDIY